MMSFIASALSGKVLKGLIAIWTKDNAYLGLTANTALITLQRHAGGYLEERKLSRLLGQIEDEILEALANHLENEYRSIKPGDKALLAENAINIISTQIFYDACFEEVFDLDRLVIRFQTQLCSAAKDVLILDRPAAVSIGRFVIAKYLAILSGLPNYETTTLKYIIRDTDEILDRVKSMEVQLGRIEHKERADQDQDEATYRNLMCSRLRKIDVFGVDTRSISKRYNLSVAYINLTLNDVSCGTTGDAPKILRGALDNCGQFLVLRGDPGSGKTTLLSWLAIECAEYRIAESIPTLAGLLPVFITVRQFSDKPLPSGADLITSQFGSGSSAISVDWAERRVKGGKILFIVDGFDEVSENRRADVSAWMSDLMEALPNCIFIVSARSYAVAQLEDLISQYGEYDSDISMEPMSGQQVNSFIENWYSAYSNEAPAADSQIRLGAAKTRLMERLSTNASLRTLIRNPLICSLLCFVNADRDGFVPDHRGELYLLATENLLDRRDRERGVTHGSETDLSKAQKFKILGYIAEYFFKRRATQLDKAFVEESLRDYLPSLGLKPDDANPILEYLCERSHTLRSPTKLEVEFSHKTFLEYFYARRIFDQSMFEVTQEAFFNEDAREVALFVFSISNEIFIERVLEVVLPRLEKMRSSKPETKRVILLLQAAITQASEVNPAHRRRSAELLSKVLPPKTLDEAEQLSLAGDVILEQLKNFATVKHKAYWVNSVHAIINTFLDEAVYALLPYAKLNDKGVDKILISGRRFFEGPLYRDIIIKECKTVSELTVHDWHDLEMVSSLPLLEKISIRQFSDNWDDANVSITPSVKKVEIIDAYSVSDFSILSNFPELQQLHISDCEQVEDYSPIKTNTNLRNLTIYAGNLSDISFISSLKNLRYLDLSECSGINDVKALNKCRSLKKVLLPYSYLYDQLSFQVEDMGNYPDNDYMPNFEDADEDLKPVNLFGRSKR